ncbi:MAG: InlB B-repeat-containing protein, partial [Defluviitaleaceae bacterium]|nr:InlB B-repeat-containing protein [Defluviitaleaceae bacterium]
MRRILCLCVAITLLVGLLPKVAFATTPVTSYSDLQAAISAAPATGVQTVIELQNSFSATGGAISIAAGQNILLTSAAGSTFTFTQATSGQRHFSVAGNLTLQNVTLSGPGGGTTAIVGGVDVSGGTLTLASGGTITNCRAPGSNSAQYGGGVNVHNQGTLIMNGGTISNNASAWVGGGVLLAGNSTFTMNSGTISGNTSVTSGGGVAIQNGYGTISGGTITGNIATASNSRGGGVSLSAANLTMTGGSITNNRANNGGGIYTDASGFITINAGTLSNNTATSNGGAIYTAQYTSNNPLPPNSYINLVINSSVVFTDNVAGSGARIPPANVGTMTHISTTYNSSIYANPLNNLDINYFGAAGVMVTYLTVTFTPGAYGTFPPGTQTQQNVPTTSAPLIPTSVPTAQPIVNYGFIGWSADGGATVLTSAQVLTTPISDNTTYVAQYAPPITLTFDAQGGTPAIQTVTPVQVTGTYANALLQVTNPTYAGHVFRGWFTAPGGVAGAVQILPTSIVTSQVNQTLYAWWVEDPTVTITFDAQGGTPPMQVVSSRVVGSPYTATLAAVVTPTLSDMAFAGWWTTPNGDTSGTQITAADTIPDGNTTVYAHWIEIPTIEIIFNAQGGTPDGQQYSLQTGSLYGDALAAITTPTRMGYAFTGWWTTLNVDTSGVQILPNTVVTA